MNGCVIPPALRCEPLNVIYKKPWKILFIWKRLFCSLPSFTLSCHFFSVAFWLSDVTNKRQTLLCGCHCHLPAIIQSVCFVVQIWQLLSWLIFSISPDCLPGLVALYDFWSFMELCLSHHNIYSFYHRTLACSGEHILCMYIINVIIYCYVSYNILPYICLLIHPLLTAIKD